MNNGKEKSRSGILGGIPNFGIFPNWVHFNDFHAEHRFRWERYLNANHLAHHPLAKIPLWLRLILT